MKVIILNWKGGANDPFSVFNATIKHHLQSYGKNVEIVEISDNSWPAKIIEHLPEGIEFVYTAQGLGSNVKVGDPGENLWDLLKVPLICVHGDHPAHMPSNHQLESRYCFHLYGEADFSRYSNQHFRRLRGAIKIDIPQLFCEPRLKHCTGDFFVFAKNISDTADTEASWRHQLEKPVFDAYMMAAETLKARNASEAYFDFHDVLDQLIVEHGSKWLGSDINMAGYRFHQYHSQLDFYLRSHRSMAALAEIREFPVRIYGSGWNKVAQKASPLHTFLPGRNMAESQEMYYSRFGLIDISPSKGMQDRTRRAIDNQTAFLSSASVENSFADTQRFDSLFFNFSNCRLSERCASVVSDPAGHLELAQEFSRRYRDSFPVRDFVYHLDLLARSVSPQ